METISKACNTCGTVYPANEAYFYKRNGTGKLRNDCRICKGGKFQKTAKAGHKICSKCNNELSVANFCRDAQKVDELSSACNQCRSNIAKMYYVRDKEKILRKQSKYRKTDNYKVTQKKYQTSEKGKQKSRSNTNSYRTRKRNLPSTLTSLQWSACKDYFDHSCCYCGEKTDVLSQEHFVPTSKGGSFSADNILPSCSSCNFSKQSKDFYDWYPKQEFYSQKREDKVIKYLSMFRLQDSVRA